MDKDPGGSTQMMPVILELKERLAGKSVQVNNQTTMTIVIEAKLLNQTVGKTNRNSVRT